MREIKFRGYDQENKVWRYGYYTKLQSGCRLYDAIIVDDKNAEERLTAYYIHDRKTISQFTGLKDKNGKEIYEGDTVELKRKLDDDRRDYAMIESQYNKRKTGITSGASIKIRGVVRYNQGKAMYCVTDTHAWYTADLIEVVGNIHQEQSP